MKKSLLYLLAIALIFGACKKDDDTDDPVAPGKPGEITLTVTQNGNVVTYKASASDAVKFIWDLGNGETPEGAEVTGTYNFPGDYEVTCTAKGRDEDRVKTQTVDVLEGDPDIFNFINLAVSGYDEATGESTAIWQWANDAGSFSCGPYQYLGDTAFFNPINDEWWACGDGENQEASLDDEYFFKLNPKMEYVNDFKDAFVVNWSWMAFYYNITVGVWEDEPYAAYVAPEASWEIKHYPNINDSLSFATRVNGSSYDGAYVIELTNGADLGIEAKSSLYQIVKLENDTMWIRYDNASPDNLYDIYANPDDLEENGITAGEPEWGYFKLVNTSTK